MKKMENEALTGNGKTLAGSGLVITAVESDKSEKVVSSTKISPVKPQVTLSESTQDITGLATAKLASTNGSVLPNEHTKAMQGETPKETPGESETSNHQPRKKRGRASTRSKASRSGNSSKPVGKRDEISSKSRGRAAPIDGAAAILAALDERAYHRSLLRDANNINHAILTPMSLPWMHAVVPVARNIPCDIDEMPEILMADDGTHTPYENGPFGFGNFAMGKMRRVTQSEKISNSFGTVRIAARRSEDPGVIQLSTIIDETKGAPYSNIDDSLIDLSFSEDDAVGEISLRCFELEQQRKQRRVHQARSLVRKQSISVRLNSTSSRSCILPETGEGGKYLEAKLPVEVQEGRFLTSKKAKAIAEKLGSYNLRHGLSAANPSGKNANRISVGRTRRMWTTKEAADQPQRVSFTSLLTGTTLDSGTQKRPREIMVGIKVNGDYVSDEGATNAGEQTDILSGTKGRTFPSLQCIMNTGKLVQNVQKSQNKTGHAQSLSKSSMGSPLVRPARLDCLPDNTGLICVSCTVPGSISISSIHPLLNHVAKDLSVCTVCWYPSTIESGPLYECSECDVMVHSQCCLDPGVVEDSKWTCAFCFNSKSETGSNASSRKRKRITRPPGWLQDSEIPPQTSKLLDPFQQSSGHCGVKCALCPFSGGAMSLLGRKGGNAWIHEVCRIWTDFSSSPEAYFCSENGIENGKNNLQQCALCGGKDTPTLSNHEGDSNNKIAGSYLVKCAAARCQVYFHPMCALLVSKLSTQSNQASSSVLKNDREGEVGNFQKSKDKDSKLASEFTLTFVDCDATTPVSGKDSGTTQTLQIPVCFCGIHNPKRERSFYGLYPGACHIDKEVMRVPPLNDPKLK